MVAFATLGLVALAVIAFFAFGPSAGAANLKFAFTKGETHRYSLSMTIDLRGGNLLGGASFSAGLDGVMRQRVVSVDDDGVATIEYSFERMTLTEGKRTQKLDVGEITRVRMAPDGEVIDVEGAALDVLSDVNPAAGLIGPESFGPLLPNSKVSPGDTWSIDEKVANPFGDAFHVTGTGTLVEERTVGKEEASFIRTQISSPLNFRFDFADIAAEAGEGLPDGFPSDSSMSFDGHLTMNMTQAMGNTSGALLSALGDVKMTGTFRLENVPGLQQLTGVLNMSMRVTMTELLPK